MELKSGSRCTFLVSCTEFTECAECREFRGFSTYIAEGIGDRPLAQFQDLFNRIYRICSSTSRFTSWTRTADGTDAVIYSRSTTSSTRILSIALKTFYSTLGYSGTEFSQIILQQNSTKRSLRRPRGLLWYWLKFVINCDDKRGRMLAWS